MGVGVRDGSPECAFGGSTEHMHMQQHREEHMPLVGAFLWLSNVSKPELCFIAGQLARFVSNPGQAHYKAALRVLIYFRGGSSHALVFAPHSCLRLHAYVDADWGYNFSVSGGIFEYMGCPIHWLSRMQRSISMSSTEAEYFAASLIAREVVYFRDLLRDLFLIQEGPTYILTDNRGVVDLSVDPVAFKKTKHILRATEFVRDMVHRRVVLLSWIPGKDNVADICTKGVTLAIFRTLMNLLTRLPDVP